MKLSRLEVLDRLIAAGWGFHPGAKIPAAVVLAAENPRVAVPYADYHEAERFRRLAFDENGELLGPKPIKAKICVICGAEHKRHNGAKTCSYACAENLRAQSVAAEAQRRVKPRVELTCVQCGAGFMGHPHQRRTCSAECSEARRKSHTRKMVHEKSESRRKFREMTHSNAGDTLHSATHWHVL